MLKYTQSDLIFGTQKYKNFREELRQPAFLSYDTTNIENKNLRRTQTHRQQGDFISLLDTTKTAKKTKKLGEDTQTDSKLISYTS
jgi:hypothetical protein